MINKTSISRIKLWLVLILAGLWPGGSLICQEVKPLVVDVTQRTRAISANPGGVNACWLMDSDQERPRETSFADAMKAMGVEFIRFPYGHLADNYLWDADGDWGNQLTPKVATPLQSPGGWEWAVNPSTGEFVKDMDFDEYISICENVGAEPMVVVNILSHKYDGGPTYEQLKETAVEWVRYANKTKNYRVKRWALGNEVDHHSDLISQEEYQALYTDFAAAMKAVDPDIWVGPGLLNKWHKEMLEHDSDEIDFLCVHNYLYAFDWRKDGYEGWKNAEDLLVNNVEKCQRIVDASSRPDLEIHVTETNSRPWADNSDNDDLFRALAYAEMLLGAASFEDVKATYVWNTHGPWGGPNENAPYNVLDLANQREPRGDIIKLVNENLLDYLVSVPRVSGFVRSYASVSEDNRHLTIFLLNKNDTPEPVHLVLPSFGAESQYLVHTYTGDSPTDESPRLSTTRHDSLANDRFETELPPHSFSIVQFTSDR